jgi:hypothetical protein
MEKFLPMMDQNFSYIESGTNDTELKNKNKCEYIVNKSKEQFH